MIAVLAIYRLYSQITPRENKRFVYPRANAAYRISIQSPDNIELNETSISGNPRIDFTKSPGQTKPTAHETRPFIGKLASMNFSEPSELSPDSSLSLSLLLSLSVPLPSDIYTIA